mmetsp:Transcript_10942/g.28153  ORF Transcript_10942/g.28153 Transcript_10942/m.28153 type:complete len:96 (-) Transcript_10942:145-432(-)
MYVGVGVGAALGAAVGVADGDADGEIVGSVDGAAVGLVVGAAVGAAVGCLSHHLHRPLMDHSSRHSEQSTHVFGQLAVPGVRPSHIGPSHEFEQK